MWECPDCGLFIAGTPDPGTDPRDCPHCHGHSTGVVAAARRKDRLIGYGVFLFFGVVATAVSAYLTVSEGFILIAVGPILVGLIGVLYELLP